MDIADLRDEMRDELSALGKWLDEALEGAMEGAEEDDLPPQIFVKAQSGDLVAQIPAGEEGDPLEPVVDQIFEAAASDAEACGGGLYTVTVEDVPGRFPLRFPDTEEEDDRRGPGGGGRGFSSRDGEDDEEDDEGEDDEDDDRFGRYYGGGRRGPGGQVEPVPGFVRVMELRDKNERALTKQLLQVVKEFTRMNSDSMRHLTDQNRALEKGRIQGIHLFEEMASRKQEREIQLKKEMRGEEIKDQVIGMLPFIGQSIAARLMGPKAISGGESGIGVASAAKPLVDMFKGFVGTITPEQLNKFMSDGTFSPEQMQMLFQLFETVKTIEEEEERTRAEKESAAANGAASPHPES